MKSQRLIIPIPTVREHLSSAIACNSPLALISKVETQRIYNRQLAGLTLVDGTANHCYSRKTTGILVFASKQKVGCPA